MINPSSNGWIDKYFLLTKDKNKYKTVSITSFYETLRNTGFIYGHTVEVVDIDYNEVKELSIDELTKLVFLEALFGVFSIKKQSSCKTDFLNCVNAFYKSIQKNNYLFLKKLLRESSNSLQLESVIDDRVKSNQNIITKNFSHIVTNALLFLDVLAFYHYIENTDFSKKYFASFEKIIYQIITISLDVKKFRTQADDLLLKLFENSLRYTKNTTLENYSLEDIDFDPLTNTLEKLYCIDLLQMALFSDEILDDNEIIFLNNVALKLEITAQEVTNSITSIQNFIQTNKKNISYFNHANPVAHFYKQTNATVYKLVTRNKNRLTNEISKSKELMVLLAKSTQRDLDDSEKKKVKKQVLEICKTIPSLAIFLLPGGGILLPILVKFIPQLLPSGFNENLEE